MAPLSGSSANTMHSARRLVHHRSVSPCLPAQSLKAELARQQETAQKAEAKAAACEQALNAEQSREGSTHALQQVCLH